MMEAIRNGLMKPIDIDRFDASSGGVSHPARTQPAFGQLVSDVLADTVSALKTAETTSTAALEGKASIQQVVDAVMQAERQLQTTLAIRDKVVAAYMDITRMQI
jgi:flagellar hook-basal body complex protein FliE